MAQVSLNKTFNNVLTVATTGNGTSAGGTETLLNTDSGKLYLIDHNHASAHTIILPALEAGLHFRFRVKTTLSANGSIVIRTSELTDGTMQGAIIEVTSHASDGAVATENTVAAGNHDTLTLSDDIVPGTSVNCFCDGSLWHVDGYYVGSAAGLATFS